MQHPIPFLLAAACTMVAASAAAAPPAVHQLAQQAMAATADVAHGQVLYIKHCVSCHGPKGWGNGPKGVPTLAGQRELYLVVQLADFARLERNGSAMHAATGTADVSNPQALRDLASYLSKAPANPHPERGDGSGLAAAQSLFQRQCAQCHGKDARGSGDEPIPALAGQHYPYTLVQLKNFATGHRGQVEPPVIDFAAGLSAGEQSAVADYLSRLK